MEFIWRRKFFGDIWAGVIRCLREVSFNRADTNPPFYTDFGDAGVV